MRTWITTTVNARIAECYPTGLESPFRYIRPWAKGKIRLQFRRLLRPRAKAPPLRGKLSDALPCLFRIRRLSSPAAMAGYGAALLQACRLDARATMRVALPLAVVRLDIRAPDRVRLFVGGEPVLAACLHKPAQGFGFFIPMTE